MDDWSLQGMMTPLVTVLLLAQLPLLILCLVEIDYDDNIIELNTFSCFLVLFINS